MKEDKEVLRDLTITVIKTITDHCGNDVSRSFNLGTSLVIGLLIGLFGAIEWSKDDISKTMVSITDNIVKGMEKQ